MSKRIASIVSYAFLLFLSCGFFIVTLGFPKGDPDAGMHASPAYYPQLLCILLAVFSAIGIYQDMFGSGRNGAGKIEIENPRNYFLVILMSSVAGVIWQYWESFYVASLVCIGVLLFFLNEGPHSVRKAAFSTLWAAVFTGFLYLCFAVLLNIQM